MTKRVLGLQVIAPAFAVAVVAASFAWSAAPAGAVPAQHATSKQTTLVVWALSETAARRKVQSQIVQQFEKQHNVKVVWENKSFSDIFTSVKLGLSGPGSPDIAQLPQGWPMVELVKANLLRPLDSYAKKYGWYSRFAKSDNRINSASANGSVFGSGHLYGVSAEDDILGVFYNKAKFANLGLAIPKTFGQFEQDLAKAKAAGDTPIELGDSDQWPLVHVSFEVIPQFVSKAAVNKFVYNKAGQLPTAALTHAANTLAGWAKDGYFNQGMLGISSDTAFSTFLKGEGVFYVGGSWYISNVEQAKATSKFGFFLLPPRKLGAKPAVVASGENAYGISTRSKNPDVAAQLLNALTGESFARRLVSEAHDLPTVVSVHPQASSSLQKDILAGLSQLQKDNGMLPWPGWSSPTMFTTLATGEQDLVGGKIDGQKFASLVRADKVKFQQSK